jgi:hypothetical protein
MGADPSKFLWRLRHNTEQVRTTGSRSHEHRHRNFLEEPMQLALDLWDLLERKSPHLGGVLSFDPVSTRPPLGLKATEVTSSSCPLKARIS